MFTFWLAKQLVSPSIQMAFGSLIMTDFSKMDRKKLRTYVLSHREDEEALRTYMDRLHNDPDVVRHTGKCDEEGLAKLEQLIREKAQGQPQ